MIHISLSHPHVYTHSVKAGLCCWRTKSSGRNKVKTKAEESSRYDRFMTGRKKKKIGGSKVCVLDRRWILYGSSWIGRQQRRRSSRGPVELCIPYGRRRDPRAGELKAPAGRERDYKTTGLLPVICSKESLLWGFIQRLRFPPIYRVRD